MIIIIDATTGVAIIIIKDLISNQMDDTIQKCFLSFLILITQLKILTKILMIYLVAIQFANVEVLIDWLFAYFLINIT